MKVRTLVILAAFALASCGGGGSKVTPALPSQSTTLPPSSPQQTSFTYGVEAVRGAQYVGPLQNDVTMGLDVALAEQNAPGLVAYAAQVSNPKSPLYRRFLTPRQIGTLYGASDASLQSAAKYFESYHLHVGTWPQHLSIFVSGAQSDLAKAFGTSFGIYTAGGKQFVAPMGTPHFAEPIPVTGVTHLVTAQRTFRDLVPIGGNGVTMAGYLPQQIRNAFDFTGAYKAGYNGSGITIGIVGTGPISANDVPAYGAMFDTSVATVVQRDVTDAGVSAPGIENPPDAGFQTPPPVTTACNGYLPDCNPEDGEAQIDTESAASLAPGSTVEFYLGYDPAYCLDTRTGVVTPGPCGTNLQPLLGITLADDEIQQVIADNSVDVLSLSYGGPEQANAGYEFDASNPTSGLGPQEFAALAAEGIAVFASSGDSGAEGCQRPAFAADIDQPCVSYPATDPSVTSVGGVTVPLDRFGNLTNQIIGWGITTGQGQGGSGGGISQYFPLSLTPWQQGLPGMTGSDRNLPDVSMLGDPATGMAMLEYAAPLGGPVVGDIGGTSVAAPEMAAMWALVLQACKASASCATAQGAKPYRLGNAAPLLYSLYANGSTIEPTYAQTFYDVVYGDNSQRPVQPTSAPLDPGYNAAQDYDQVTGIGVPFARALIKAVTHQ
ncbi:MAG: S8 family serine peptidase [bacterium]|nr:S8 family serine peptidase [bacterium]